LNLREQSGSEHEPDEKQQQRIGYLGPVCKLQNEDAQNDADQAGQQDPPQFDAADNYFVEAELPEAVDLGRAQETG